MKREYLDQESYFYQITERGGEKYISIDGYYYKTDADFGNGSDRSVAFSGLEIPLQEFVNNPQYTVNADMIEKLAEDCKQYYKEVVFEREDSFYHNTVATELLLSDVTMGTPCGCYVDFDPVIVDPNVLYDKVMKEYRKDDVEFSTEYFASFNIKMPACDLLDTYAQLQKDINGDYVYYVKNAGIHVLNGKIYNVIGELGYFADLDNDMVSGNAKEMLETICDKHCYEIFRAITCKGPVNGGIVLNEVCDTYI